MVKLEIKNLSKIFKLHQLNGTEITGFQDINFSVDEGEFLALQGSSGTGKSSILKSIYRTYLVTSGDIHYYYDKNRSINIAKAEESDILKLRKNEIGYISQFLKALPRVSCANLVAQPLIDLGESQTIAIKKAKELLNDFNIKEELFDISPLTFSGGEQQRVNIARGIIAPKPLLLLDEPTASLDEKNTNIVIDKLKRLKKNGVSMIGIFHSKEVMQNIADKVYDLKEKRICKL